MADNLASTRDKLKAQRKTVRTHAEKWRVHVEPYEKTFALKTIENAQKFIQKLKSDHPTLRNDDQPEDNWKPGDRL
ncbi:hypothetical protein AB0P21_12760 [Kribbella sp. NPDC056861]|uniref:hypothetical protein n=1 Tax=Kribbella sp. NPDC056861 TaxID=3154857 RepID=UPI00342E04C2